MEVGAIGSCPATKCLCSELNPGNVALKGVCPYPLCPQHHPDEISGSRV